MTLEQLLALGLTEEVANSVIAAHQESIKNNYVPLSRFSEVNGKMKDLEGQLTDRDKQLKDLEKSAAGNEELEQQIKDLRAENKKAKEEYKIQLDNMSIDNAINLWLKENNTKYGELLKDKFDRKTLVVKEDGTIEGIEVQGDKIKESYADLFTKAEDAKAHLYGINIKDLGGGAAKDGNLSLGEMMAQQSNQQAEKTNSNNPWG